MRYAIVITALIVIFFSGCTADRKQGQLDDEFERMSEEERIRMCTKFYRDAKLSCREGLQDQAASQSFECLSARMKLDRYCLTPR